MGVGAKNSIGQTSSVGSVADDDDDSLDGTSASPQGSLPPPTMGSDLDSITKLMMFLDDAASKRQQGVDARRDAADKSQEAHEKQAVADMRSEANDTFKGAVISGTISIVGGASALAGSCVQAQSVALESQGSTLGVEAKDAAAKGVEYSVDADKLSSVGLDGTGVATQGEQFSADAQNLATRSAALNAQGAALKPVGSALESSKGIFDGVAKGFDGFYAKTTKQDQANEAEQNDEAQAAARQSKSENDTSQELHDMQEKIVSRLEALLQTVQQGRLALVQRA